MLKDGVGGKDCSSVEKQLYPWVCPSILPKSNFDPKATTLDQGMPLCARESHSEITRGRLFFFLREAILVHNTHCAPSDPSILQ